jgi:tetratricopeptide (TPR) repeat protein
MRTHALNFWLRCQLRHARERAQMAHFYTVCSPRLRYNADVNQGICLNMIVKNEAHVLRRCLERVKPFIDSWVIVDTGSTDGTQELIRQVMGSHAGLYERPWKDFGSNRTEALELARKSGAKYAFVIDADEEFMPGPSFAWPRLEADSYHLLQANGATRFWRTQLMRLAMPWRYVGVLHEVAMCDGARPAQRVEGVVTYGRFDSARNHDPIEKYRRDAQVLESALEQDPKNARYMFYLAQSYRDCKELEKAEQCYQKRSEMGGWAEEVYVSLFQIGCLREQLKRPVSEILAAHLRAFNYRPTRSEPLVALARYFRMEKEWGSCRIFAQAALDIPMPKDILFMDSSAYEWRARDEYSIATYWLGQYEESLSSSNRLLEPGSSVPEEQRERILKNQRFALDKLGRQ